jgi:hypothetical protein
LKAGRREHHNSRNDIHNCIHVQIKSRLNSGNACYHSVRNLLYVCYQNTQSLRHEKYNFAARFDEMTGGWRKLNHEELHNLYSSPSIIVMMEEDEIGRAGSTNGGEEESI